MDLKSPIMKITKLARQRHPLCLPITDTQRRNLIQKIIPNNVTQYMPPNINTFSETFMCQATSKSSQFESLIESIAFYIFKSSSSEIISAINKYIDSYTNYSEYGDLINFARCLSINIFCFTDSCYPPKKVSPKILNQDYEGDNDGSIILNFQTSTKTYAPVIAYNADKLTTEPNSKDLFLKNSHGNIISVNKDVLSKLSPMFTIWPEQEINTNLSAKSLQIILDFLSDNWSLNICLLTDSELYNFAWKFKIRMLLDIFEKKLISESDPESLTIFMSRAKHVNVDIVSRFINILQTCNLQTLERLSQLENGNLIQKRLEMLHMFRSKIGTMTFDDHFTVVRIKNNWAEAFVGTWLPLPLNFYLLKDVYRELCKQRLQKKHLMKDNMFLFINDNKLGWIDIVSPCQSPHYSEIPSGGLNVEAAQLCISDHNNIYLFEKESAQIAPVSADFQVGNWTKLDNCEYVISEIHNTSFVVINVNEERFFFQTDQEVELIAEENKTMYIFTIDNSYSKAKVITLRQSDISLKYNMIPFDTCIHADDREPEYMEFFSDFQEDIDDYLYFLVQTPCLSFLESKTMDVFI